MINQSRYQAIFMAGQHFSLALVGLIFVALFDRTPRALLLFSHKPAFLATKRHQSALRSPYSKSGPFLSQRAVELADFLKLAPRLRMSFDKDPVVSTASGQRCGQSNSESVEEPIPPSCDGKLTSSYSSHPRRATYIFRALAVPHLRLPSVIASSIPIDTKIRTRSCCCVL